MSALSAQGTGRHFDFVAALKRALLSALIAFGLFSLMIGIKTDTGPAGALVLSGRPKALAIIVGVVFAGAFVREFLLGERNFMPSLVLPASLRTSAKTLTRLAGLALLAFAIAVPIIFSTNRYLLDIGIMVLTYVMLGWGLNIVVGLAGLLDLGYVAFYAVGAYSYALLAEHFGFSFWICLPLAGILASFWGIILGFPVLRLRGDYLAIVTLAFGEIVRLILINWQSLTHGPDGITGVPRPSFFGLPFNNDTGSFADTFGLQWSPIHRIIFLYYLILVLALITNLVTIRLRRLPIGRAWEALREDEIACRSLGINTTNTKLTAFAMGAMFAGFAGSFFATRQGFISPESFTFTEFGIGAGHRGARRHGLANRRGGGRDGDAGRLRVLPRIRAVPHADLRPRDGRDHDLAAARSGSDARAHDFPRPGKGRSRGGGQTGARGDMVAEAAACLTPWPARSSPSSICRCGSAASSRSKTSRSPPDIATSPR